jgi:hypothetical protein
MVLADHLQKRSNLFSGQATQRCSFVLVSYKICLRKINDADACALTLLKRREASDLAAASSTAQEGRERIKSAFEASA